MSFYGIEATSLGLYEAKRLCCSKCGEKNSVSMKVFARYFHISRIPSFPLGKIGVAICRHCKFALNDEAFKDQQQYAAAYRELQSKTTVPYWSYAGSAISGSLLVWALLQTL